MLAPATSTSQRSARRLLPWSVLSSKCPIVRETGACPTAFFASTADFLCWRATSLPALHLFPSFQFDTTNPRSSTNSLFVEFVGVYDYLVRLGAEVMEIVGDVGAEEPLAEQGSEE
eukprot:226532-Rhodomonas_salina.1